MVRTARCSCGACSIQVRGEPSLNGVCHCDDCRRRTGSAFGWQAYFPDDQVLNASGDFTQRRIRDEQVRSFCPACGTTLFWTSAFMPGHTGVAAGAFTETPLLPPSAEAAALRRHDWLNLPDGLRRLS